MRQDAGRGGSGTARVLGAELEAKAVRIRLLLFDVDGVLTDGKVQIHGDGTESKQFDIKDGISMVWAQRAGLTVGLLSARTSASTVQRAKQLGIRLMHQGVASKIDTYRQIVGKAGVGDAEVAYMGDDIVDLAVLERVGLSTAPADAVEEVRSRVHWVSRENGGAGAARELIETILRAQGRWDGIVASYRADPSSATSPATSSVVGEK
jgi:3-deoxy-D-manno-octulosonate 8-phosphate phosphatase (KDO 8-P phosphatase)